MEVNESVVSLRLNLIFLFVCLLLLYSMLCSADEET